MSHLTLRPSVPSSSIEPLRGAPPARWIYAVFFVSGFTALIYEVTWLNRIQLLLGHSVFSLSITLASFLSGLAAGALLAPRLIATRQDPLWLYLIAELAVGVYGILFYPLLKLAEKPYLWWVDLIEPGLFGLSAMQFIFCGSLVLIPTLLMGATLPLLSEALYRRKNEISEKSPTLYGVNALGGCAGALICGFVMLPALGYQDTVLLAAFFNVSLFLAASMLLPESRGKSLRSLAGIPRALLSGLPTPGGMLSAIRDSRPDWPLLATLLVSGSVSILVQILWNRYVAMGFGPHPYNFPIVTALVLGGIASGSFLFRRISSNAETASRVICILPFAAACAFMVGTHLLSNASRFALWVHFNLAPDFGGYMASEMIFLAVTIFPCALMLGGIFPAAITLLTRDRDQASSDLARGYAVNIVGFILGGILGSFVLIPLLGMEGIRQGIIGSLLVLSAGLGYRIRGNLAYSASAMAAGLILFSVIPTPDSAVMTEGWFYNRVNKASDEEALKFGFSNPYDYVVKQPPSLIASEDDVHATVSVHQYSPGKRSFKINGKVDGGTGGDIKTTELLALLPLLVNPKPRSALTIGLGVGSTVATTLNIPGMQSSGVVEISRSMIKFAEKYFGETSGNIWNDPRFNIYNRDGREYLRNGDSKFDVIISEPSNPWVEGVASLFTSEYFQEVSGRLTDNGVAMIWFHTYALDCVGVASVIRSAAMSFKHLRVFGISGDLYLLGWNHGDSDLLTRLPASLASQERKIMEIADVPEGAVDERYDDLAQSSHWFNGKRAMVATESFAENTDDNQVLQFAAGATFFKKIRCGFLDAFRDTKPEGVFKGLGNSH